MQEIQILHRKRYKEINIYQLYQGREGKCDIATMVTNRMVELANNLNCRWFKTHGYKINKIQYRKQVKVEEKERLKNQGYSKCTTVPIWECGIRKRQKTTPYQHYM